MGEQKANQTEQDLNHVLKARRDKLAELQAAGKDPFQITKYDVTAHSTEIRENYSQWEEKEVSIAGRMMFKRVMGKASFCNLQDLKGRIQVYVARDSVGEESYKEFKKLDIGDIVGVKGTVFTTKTGEISVHATEFTLLSKSLQVLPEKFHGLTDTDLRYRQRYVDLIMNEEVKDTFIKRSRILAAIRKYLGGEGFMEVETPMLVSNAGGAAARPFETYFNALDEKFKLRISLELYLKRLIVGGLERVYEIGRVFRNEGLDTRHNPEFTLMELYQAYTDYHGMMDLTENLYRFVAQEVLGTTKISYNGVEMDLGKPFERITMVDAVKKYSGVDFNEILIMPHGVLTVHDTPTRCDHCPLSLHRSIDLVFYLQETSRPALLNDFPQKLSLLLLNHQIRIDKPVSQTLCRHNPDRTFSGCRHPYKNEILLHPSSSFLLSIPFSLEKRYRFCLSFLFYHALNLA